MPDNTPGCRTQKKVSILSAESAAVQLHDLADTSEDVRDFSVQYLDISVPLL